MLRRLGLLPQEFASRRIEGGDNAADADRVQFPVVKEWSRLWTGAVLRRRIGGLVWGRVVGPPNEPACRGVEGSDRFGAVAPGEGVDGFANDDGRRIAFADLDLPSARQFFGPRFRLRESTRGAVAVSPTPLRIILRRALSRSSRRRSDQDGCRH